MFKEKQQYLQVDSYIDGNRLLRVRGWLNQLSIYESVKRPLLKSKGSILARLIIKWHHEKVAHSG